MRLYRGSDAARRGDWSWTDSLDVATATNALEIGTHAAHAETPGLTGLEVTQIGVEAADSPIAVMTYEPKRYSGLALNVMDMQPC